MNGKTPGKSGRIPLRETGRGHIRGEKLLKVLTEDDANTGVKPSREIGCWRTFPHVPFIKSSGMYTPFMDKIG